MNIPTVFPVTCHTDHVTYGSTFVAIKGAKYDGIEFIALALKKGATTIVVDECTPIDNALLAEIQKSQAKLIYVSNTRGALASLSAAAAGYPARKLSIIGITGTKGKTTTTYILEHIFRTAGIKVARITGVRNSIDGHEVPANLTTPQPDYLHQFFKVCVEKGVTHVIMEVAAQALSLNRIDTIQLDRVIFTNIAREHFEFYENIQDYFNAKCLILNNLAENGFCFVNGDDKQCATLISKGPHVMRYGFAQPVEVLAQDISNEKYVTITYNDKMVTCPSLIGHYNASNILAACAIAESYTIPHIIIQSALITCPAIPGRMEKYTLANGATCIIDYAHNPSSYEALLSTIRPLTKHLIVLFGASGSRDSGKRPLMGSIAAHYADIVILTSDNPGTINPLHIIETIVAGIETNHRHKVVIEIDRTQAIKQAYSLSNNESYILLLGKGTDEYQIIGTTKYNFSERMLIQSL